MRRCRRLSGTFPDPRRAPRSKPKQRRCGLTSDPAGYEVRLQAPEKVLTWDYSLIAEDPPVLHASQVRGCMRLPIRFTPTA